MSRSSSRTSQGATEDKNHSDKLSKDASKDPVDMMSIFKDLQSKLSSTDMASVSGLNALTETLKKLERLNESQGSTSSDKTQEKDKDSETSKHRPRKHKSKTERSTHDSKRESPDSRRRESNSPSRIRRNSPNLKRKRSRSPFTMSPEVRRRESPSSRHRRDSVSPPRRNRDSVSPSRRRRNNQEYYFRRSPKRRSRSNSPKTGYRRRLSSMSPPRPQDHQSVSPIDQSRNSASNSGLSKETILPQFEGRGPPHLAPGPPDTISPYHHQYFDYPPAGQPRYPGYPPDHPQNQQTPLAAGGPPHPGHPVNFMGPTPNAMAGHPPMDGGFHPMGPDGMFTPHNMEMPPLPPMFGPGEFPPLMQQGIPPAHMVPVDGYSGPPAVDNDDFLGNSDLSVWQEGKQWEDDVVYVPNTAIEAQTQFTLQQNWEAAEEEKRKAVENEKKQQKLTLMKQRKEYIDKQTVLRSDLDKLSKEKKTLEQERACHRQRRRVRDNEKEQTELQNKIKAITNVIEMLSGIIGDDEVVEVDSAQTPHSQTDSARQNSGRPQSRTGKTPPSKTPPLQTPRRKTPPPNTPRPKTPPPKTPSFPRLKSPPALPKLPLSPILQRSPSPEIYTKKKITPGSTLTDRVEDRSSTNEPGAGLTTSWWGNSKQSPQETMQTWASKSDVERRETAMQQRETHPMPKTTANPDPEPEPEPATFNIIHFDPELHWCRVCNVFPRTAKEYLNHLHSGDHKQNLASRNLADMPWHSSQPQEEPVPSNKDGPPKRVPIKGLQFFVSACAWYCKLCRTWIGDLHCASIHLKSLRHSQEFTNFTEKNAQWEVEWLTERTRAYEYSAEDRIRVEAQKQQQRDNKSELSTTHEQLKPAVKKEPKVSKRSKKLSKKRSSSSSSETSTSSCSSCDSNTSKRMSWKKKSKFVKNENKSKKKSSKKTDISEVKSKCDSPEHESGKNTCEVEESAKSDSPVHKLLNECMGMAKNLKSEDLKEWISELSGKIKLKAELIKSVEAVTEREARYKKTEVDKKNSGYKMEDISENNDNKDAKKITGDTNENKSEISYRQDKTISDNKKDDKSEKSDRKDKKTTDDKKEGKSERSDRKDDKREDKSERNDRKDDSLKKNDRKDDNSYRFDRNRLGNQRNYRNTKRDARNRESDRFKQRNNKRSPEKSINSERKSKNYSSSRSPDKSSNIERKSKTYEQTKLKTDDLKPKVVNSEAKTSEIKRVDNVDQSDRPNQTHKKLWLPSKSDYGLTLNPNESNISHNRIDDVKSMTKPTTERTSVIKPISMSLTKPKLPFIGKLPSIKWKAGLAKKPECFDEHDDSSNDSISDESRIHDEQRNKGDEIKSEENKQREDHKQRKDKKDDDHKEEVRRDTEKEKKDEELLKFAQHPVPMFHQQTQDLIKNIEKAKQTQDLMKNIEKAKQVFARFQKVKEVDKNEPVDMEIDDEDKPEESLPSDFKTSLNILFPENSPGSNKIQVEKVPTIRSETSSLGSIPLPSMTSGQTGSGKRVQGADIVSRPMLTSQMNKGSGVHVPTCHAPIEIRARINQVVSGPSPGGSINPLNSGPVAMVQKSGPMPMVQNSGPMPIVQHSGFMPIVQHSGPVPIVQHPGLVPMVQNSRPVLIVQHSGPVPMVQNSRPMTIVQHSGPVPMVQLPTTDARFPVPHPSIIGPSVRPVPPPQLSSTKEVVKSVNIVNKKELLLAKEKELQEKINKQLEMISSIEKAKKNQELDDLLMLGIDVDDQAVQKY